MQGSNLKKHVWNCIPVGDGSKVIVVSLLFHLHNSLKETPLKSWSLSDTAKLQHKKKIIEIKAFGELGMHYARSSPILGILNSCSCIESVQYSHQNLLTTRLLLQVSEQQELMFYLSLLAFVNL